MDLIRKMFGSPVAGVSAQEAKSRMGQKNKPYLLDVRQPEEYRSERIQGAKLIPLGELEKRMHELPKNQEIICICRSGNRSGTAARRLTEAGYTVSNLNGGMIAWIRAGLPVKKGSA